MGTGKLLVIILWLVNVYDSLAEYLYPDLTISRDHEYSHCGNAACVNSAYSRVGSRFPFRPRYRRFHSHVVRDSCNAREDR